MWSWIGLRARYRSSSDASGFTLIEVLVALAVLALTLAALLQVFTTSLRNAAASERHLVATMLARSVLDEIGSEIPLISGERSAEIEQGYRWTVRIWPSTTIAPVADAEWLLVPYDVQVEILWNDKPVTTLTTLRLAAEPHAVDGNPNAPSQSN